MTWDGTPVTFTGVTISLGGGELAAGGTTEFTFAVTGDMSDLPVAGSAPYKETVLAGNIQATGTLSYAVDGGTAVKNLTQAEQALVVTGTGFVFTAAVVLSGSDGGFSQADVLKGQLNYATSGSFTFATS